MYAQKFTHSASRAANTTRVERYRGWLAAAVAVTFLGFALRVYDLGTHSFWIDELLTLGTALGGVEAFVSVRDHPPLLYFISSLTLTLLGESEFALRLPAAFAGTMAIPLLAAFGAELRRPRAGIWAALLLAVSPLHLHHSQEARHYPWLLLFTLISFLFLHRALKRNAWKWWALYVSATFMNLYTHYGALIVLATQMLIIAAWLSKPLLAGRRRVARARFVPPVAAGTAIALLYLPWLPRLMVAITRNVGEEITTGTGSATPLSQWLAIAVRNFSPDPGTLSTLTLVACLLGGVLWIGAGGWKKALFTAAALMVPLLLIVIFDIARGAYARYILNLLPFYLFFAGIWIAFILHALRRLGPIPYGLGAVALLVGILFVGGRAAAREYALENSDWRGILAYLDERAAENDLVVMMNLNFARGFNRVSSTFPYYLRRHDITYQSIPAARISFEDALSLDETDVDVWFVIDNYVARPQMRDLPFDVAEFDRDLFVLSNPEQPGTTLEKMITLYRHITPLANAPAPQCALRAELGTLYAAGADYDAAYAALAASMDACPRLVNDTQGRLRSRLMRVAEEALLRSAVAESRWEDARRWAARVLAWNGKDEAALKVLTVFDLRELFLAGDADVAENDAPESVRSERFVMPQNGDWGDVLLIHPPATVSYAITLPDRPVRLATRVALAPQSWSWGGDGVTFVVHVTDESGVQHELSRYHVSNQMSDRRWHRLSVSLAGFAGQEIMLTLSSEPGPAGDLAADWAGWASPRILWEE